MKRVGLLQLSEKALLSWLDFEGGTIRDCKLSRWGYVEFLIEHPDLPELHEGDAIPPIQPLYSKETDEQGHTVSVTRIHPAKVSPPE